MLRNRSIKLWKSVIIRFLSKDIIAIIILKVKKKIIFQQEKLHRVFIRWKISR